jgi:hypothetical protein
MELYRLIYTSRADRTVNAKVVNQIVSQAVTNNRAQGITGVLFFLNHRFYQVLEGDKFFVQQLYLRICRDKRHHSVELLALNPIHRRAFSEWFMGSRDTALPGAALIEEDNVAFVLLNLHELIGGQDHLPPLYHEGETCCAPPAPKPKRRPTKPRS